MDILSFIKENAAVLTFISPFFIAMGGVIFTFLKWVYKKIVKNTDKKTCEIRRLENEVTQLKNKIKQYENVRKADNGDYLILAYDDTKICPICWWKDFKPIPITEHFNSGEYLCGVCKNYGIFDKTKCESLKNRKKQTSHIPKWP